MEVDEESDQIDGLLEQFSSQSTSSSQRVNGSQRAAVPPPIPQSNVGNRRNRKAEKDGGSGGKPAVEPGFGNPLNIQKNKRILLDGLRHILAHKKTAIPSKKDAFNATPLDKIDEVADYLELSETGELLRYSSMVYGLRVDTTYNDAMSTNCQLQPNRMKSEDMGKKSKAEQKLQQSTATQSLNLQKLQCEMDQDAPEDDQSENPTPPASEQTDNDAAEPQTELGGGGEGEGAEGDGGMAGLGSDGEEERREEELTEEERAKWKDTRPVDTDKIKYSNTAIRDIIAEEYKRRQRNLDRKCDLNPMLMDDERKYRMAPAALLTNEYYQIATARYKELNASGMLAYNAKVTHNGRMTLMHKRMDTWKDAEAQDHTPPTRPFRRALGGLVDNAMRDADHMHIMPNYLFDAKDVAALTRNKLTSGTELADIEKKTREKILHASEFDFLDKDDQIIGDDDEEDEERESTASPPPPRPRKEGGEGRQSQGGDLPSSLSRSNSANPSTPAAETEASEASTGTTPQQKDDEPRDLGAMSQAEIDDYMEVMSAAPRKRKFRKATALTAVLCDDEIERGPVLYTDDLPSKFSALLYEKCVMGSRVDWERGANCEELWCDPAQLNEECMNVEKGSTDMDLMHLDRLWTSKYYKRQFTPAEVRDIKEKMRKLMNDNEMKNKLTYFKAGEYEFLGEDDEWTNPDIAPDEAAPLAEDEILPLVRPLEDREELARLQRVIAAEDDSDEEHAVFEDDDERIVVHAESANGGDGGGMDDFLMSDVDDGPCTSSTGGEPRTDFTAGDDQRRGELADVHGMLDPTFQSGIQPSATVRGIGKADDSNWKGGLEAAKAKKEKKKKEKEEAENPRRTWFDLSDPLLVSKKKLRGRFKQATKNVELMKETDQLLMPVQTDILPQTTGDASQFYQSFFLPKMLPPFVDLRDPNEKEDGVIRLDHNDRLEHYTAMLDSSIASTTGEREDVFLGFMRTFKNFTEVATVKEMEIRERVRSGEMTQEEADAALRSPGHGAIGSSSGGADDYDDFGGGGGMDDDFGGGDEEASSAAAAVAANPAAAAMAEIAAAREERAASRRAESQARSIALASAHGYGMRTNSDDGGDDEADAYAKMGDREYHLRLIKLDTVAMKTALSDVLTNPLMVAEKLDETLGHFNRVFATQQPDGECGKKKKTGMQTIHEDEEMDFVDERSEYGNHNYDDHSFDDHSGDQDPQEIIDQTVMELPDAMNVTRALFAPVKEKAKTKTMTFGANAANTSQQNKSQPSQPHIELKGHHTLKSTFTCLPARLPMKATSDVTVASTISMILHLANEHNLILEQEGQDEGVNVNGNDEDDGNMSNIVGDWMNDFEVHCLDDDAHGTKMAKMSKRISNAVDVLQQLSADEDMSDAQKRQEKTEKMLAEVAAKQREEAEEERRQMEEEERMEREEEERMNRANGVRRDKPGTSSDAVVDLSDDEIIEVGEKSPAFKIPAAPKRVIPKPAGNEETGEGPSTKRTRRSSGGQADETIVLE